MIQNKVKISTAQPVDLESYIDLLEEVADWLHEKGLTPLPRGIYREFEDFYASSISLGEVHLAFIGADLVGAVRLAESDRVVWPADGVDAFCLENLVVRRTWSHRGVGRQLLSWAEEQTAIAHKTCLRLDCFANNAILRKYYEDAGYTGCGEVNAHYPFGVLCLQRYQKRVEERSV